MVKVLVLSAPYGSGHDRAAAALAQAFVAEGARVETADHFTRFVSPVFARASLGLFWTILRRAPWLWGAAYALSARLPTRSRAMGGMDRLGARALRAHLAATRPDAVVHVHPTPAGAMAWLRVRGEARAPHGIVLTDFVAHPQWIYPGLDRYFVAADEVREGLVARGVPPARVVVTGIPIDTAFSVPLDRAEARQELGLDPATPVVLVTGGMRGTLGATAEACEVLAGLGEPFHAVAVCGDHAGLETALRARVGADRRFRVLGRVSGMHRFLAAADLAVTKAGGSTCAEALALGCPLVLYGSLPGQERANEACLGRAGAAVCPRDRAALQGVLGRLLRDPGQRSVLAASARRLGRPDAARVVAKEMLALAGGER